MKVIYKINLIFLLFFAISISELGSQNKIQSDHSKYWKKIETKEFIIYFPQNYGFLALKTLTKAKKAIQYYSTILQHQLSHQIIIILYPNFMDFQSSHILPYMLPEGVAGYTESNLERVVLPFNGDEKEFFYTLTHELVHSFQYDIILNHLKIGNINLPLWLIEGLPEYLSNGTEDMDAFLRDLVLSKRLPDLYNVREGYTIYKIGQSVMYFIHHKWSIHHINLLFRNLLLTKDLQLGFKQTFQLDYLEFNIQWKQFIYERYKENYQYLESQNRITFRYTDILLGREPFHFKPTISPDGETIAFFSYENLYPSLVIQHLQNPFLTKREIEMQKTVLQFLKDEQFEEWQPLTTKINFDPSKKLIYIPTRKKSQLAIVVYDIQKKTIEKVYKLPLDSISEPSLSKSKQNKLVFVGSLRGFSDIYILDLETELLSRITYNFEREKSPIFSIENQKILFIKEDNKKNLVLSYDLDKKKYSLIFALNTEIASIQEGYYKIQNEWKRGIYYTAKFNDKMSLFFYSNNNHYLVSNNNRDIVSFDVNSKGENESYVVYTTLEEGTYEIFYLDFTKKLEKWNQFYTLSKEQSKSEFVDWSQNRSYLEKITTCCDIKSNLFLKDSFSNYKTEFFRKGFPFIALTGAVDSKGNTSLVFLGYASFADLQNKHSIEGFITYQEKPVILNGEIQYTYNLNKMQSYTGIYSYNGVFAILNPLDLSLNNIIYNPFQRLLNYSTYGLYGSLRYYFHNYSSFGIHLDVGREEQIFLPKLPEERQNEDVLKNHLTLRYYYLYDTSKYSIFGPLDGISFLIGYEIPIETNSYDKVVYQTVIELRYYELFRDFSLFAYRLFIGAQTGKDSKNFPYRIGGYSTIRGYDFQKFEGKYAFLMNIEYRFTFIEQLMFGFPTRWSPGLIRGAFFMDLGAAFDDPKKFQAFDGKQEVTKDLKASIGIGVHLNNFLWFIFPGAVMKIEWASPYDGKTSLPFSKWQGRFSLGFVF